MSASVADQSPVAPPSRIALIGLGKMGLPMGRRLLGAGYAVQGFDPVASARAAFEDAGGVAHASAASAAADTVAVVTMLPDGQVVTGVMLDGDEPAIAAMRNAAPSAATAASRTCPMVLAARSTQGARERPIRGDPWQQRPSSADAPPTTC